MSGPVSTWVGDRLRAGIPSRYVTSQLVQLSLAPLRGRLIEYQLRLGKGGNVTSAWWQVTLCDPMWHTSSRSGVATLRTAIHLLLTYYRPVKLSTYTACISPLIRLTEDNIVVTAKQLSAVKPKHATGCSQLDTVFI